MGVIVLTEGRENRRLLRRAPSTIRRFGFVLLFVAATTIIGTTRVNAQALYSIGNPSPEQQYMLELTNRARANGGAEATRLQGYTSNGSPTFTGGLQEGPPNINGQSFTIANTAQPLSWNPLLANSA